MKALNIVEIEEKIISDLKGVRSGEALRDLQKWAKKAKKEKVIDFAATSFKQFNYQYSYTSRGGSGSKARYHNVNNVNYTSFMFLGVEVRLPDGKYVFNDLDYKSHKIWVDKKIKYGGVEYFPKNEVKEINGIDLEKLFLSFLEENKYFIVDKGTQTYHLCNDERNANKILCGRRLNQFDLCNNQVSKINREQKEMLSHLRIVTWETINNKQGFPF